VRGLEDTAALKAQFGARLAFHGSIDVQQLLPNATVEEVRWEVARRMQDLGANGGFIIAPCHNIGPDIPPENVVALFDAVQEYGRYPLRLGRALESGASYFQRHGHT
jgi:uroporphyrinogen decarboxylase